MRKGAVVIARRYGLPYKGSKNTIAEWVVDHLPGADVLMDVFCGGCAVTHAAMLSGKFDRIIANDLAGDMPQLFLDAINGKYADERRWISREDFFRLKDTDAYVRTCWSFGNDCCTYMYGREIEPAKEKLHKLIFADTPAERMTAWRLLLKEQRKLDNLESQQRLQNLQRLENLQRLQISGVDYRDLQIPENAVIYCDPPYNCTKDCYGIRFDRRAFLDWANAQSAPVIISEYDIEDDRFAVLAETTKKQLIQGAKTQKTVTERLYAPKRQIAEIQARLEGEHGQQIEMKIC